MQFCHISPTKYIEPLEIGKYPSHLLLAHLVESDPLYVDYYSQHKAEGSTQQRMYILDNSAYELYRQGLPMFDGDKLIALGQRIQADYIVMPDYPGENCGKTASAAIKYGTIFKERGFGTFFVPQSRIGHFEEYISSFAWAACSPYVDYIGMSILGIPNAFGADSNDLQRFISRLSMLTTLRERGLLDLTKQNGKKIHCLGMTDGPNEIAFLRAARVLEYIDTWDSSAAVWAGIEGVAFDNSPTGLVNGKVKTHVDFGIGFDESKVPLIKKNMKVIDELANPKGTLLYKQ